MHTLQDPQRYAFFAETRTQEILDSGLVLPGTSEGLAISWLLQIAKASMAVKSGEGCKYGAAVGCGQPRQLQLVFKVVRVTTCIK